MATVIRHKSDGRELASFDLDATGRATIKLHTCNDFGVVLSRATYAFTDDATSTETPYYAAHVVKSGAKWDVTIEIKYMSDREWDTLLWSAGEFSGSRGTAVYRAFLAFGAGIADGSIATVATVKAAREESAPAPTTPAIVSATFSPAMVGDQPERARKGANASHIMRDVPAVMGSWTVTGLCTTVVGSSGDDDVTMGTDLDGPACKRCEKIFASFIARRDAFVTGLFAPEIGTDGKPWVAGDNPARRVPDESDESAPVAIPVPRIVKTAPVVKADREALVRAERERRAARHAERIAKRERDAQEVRDESAPTPVSDAPAASDESAPIAAPDAVEFDDVSHEKGMPRRIYPTGAESHILLKPSTVSGTWELVGICRDVIGDSADESITVSTKRYGKRCERCDSIYAGILSRETDFTIQVCEFAGHVNVINAEGTHGKCPACSTYIPILDESEGKPESGPKSSGEPCGSVGSAPVPGTRVLRDNHAQGVSDDYQGKTSAPCPGCRRVIAVSRDGVMRRHHGVIAPVVADESGKSEFAGKIGTHNVRNLAAPVNGKALKSQSMDVVGHGTTTADPAGADKRRGSETRCKMSRKVLKGATGGDAECPDCTRTVELKIKPAKGDGDPSWMFAEHVRMCACPGGECVGCYVNDSFARSGADGRGERRVTPTGRGADAGKGSRDHGSVNGSANVGSQNMPPVQPKGWIGRAGTGQLPATVRAGVDPVVAGEICPLEECGGWPVEIAHADKTRSWRRRHSTKVGAVIRERNAVNAAKRAGQVAEGRAMSPAERKARRAAASIGSFAEGVNAHTGAVTHGPRPAAKSTVETPEQREARRKIAKAKVSAAAAIKGKGKVSAKAAA